MNHFKLGYQYENFLENMEKYSYHLMICTYDRDNVDKPYKILGVLNVENVSSRFMTRKENKKGRYLRNYA